MYRASPGLSSTTRTLNGTSIDSADEGSYRATISPGGCVGISDHRPVHDGVEGLSRLRTRPIGGPSPASQRVGWPAPSIAFGSGTDVLKGRV